MNREFTGRHMAAVLVGGLGIVVVVNLFMATHAVSGFGGVIVDNSYVASQKFNGWLDEAEKSRALGWKADVRRDAQGHVEITSTGVPENAALSAMLRRPLGEKERITLAFTPLGEGRYRSTAPVSAGRWTVRLTITAEESVWASEGPLG